MQLKRNDHHQGAASLLLVLFLMMLATLIVVSIQSLLLAQIKRNRSTTDLMIADYHAESRIYDILGSLRYPSAAWPTQQEENLADGTKIKIAGTSNPNDQKLSITASRPFGVSLISADRHLQTNTQNLEVVFALDCTGSMTQPACEDPTNPACAAKQKMELLRDSLTGFLSSAADPKYKNKISIGMSIFTTNARWMKGRDKNNAVVDITPTSNFDPLALSQIVTSADFGFGRYGQVNGIDGSPACLNSGPMIQGTSVGSGLAFMRDYYKSIPPKPNTKRIEIIITDGLPNARIPYPECIPNTYLPDDEELCCPSGSRCAETQQISGAPGWQCTITDPATNQTISNRPYQYGLARDFISCTLTPTNKTWESVFGAKYVFPGVRDPAVDVYSVTVLDLPPTSQVYKIFNAYSTKYFSSSDAYKLPEFLQEFFKNIVGGVETLSIHPG